MSRWDTFEAFLREVEQLPSVFERQDMVEELLRERRVWPWIEENRATFIYVGTGGHNNVALNLDTIRADPPFAPMTNLDGTTLWYVQRQFAPDDLLDYLLAVDDPLTPLARERNIVERMARHWRPDPRNPLQINTGHITVSVLRMPQARPFPDWSAMREVQRGTVEEHSVDSKALNFSGRKLWVYMPPDYKRTNKSFPLLILHDGQWAHGPLQVPYITDAMLKHKHLTPLVIAMIQSGGQEERTQEYISNDSHTEFLVDELIPFIRKYYRIDAASMGVGGVAEGAVAAAHAALQKPELFGHLLMISPPLGKGRQENLLKQYAERFEQANALPQRIFQSVGRYEVKPRFYTPAMELRYVLERRRNVEYHFLELGSGHGLVGFRSVLPEAMAWVFPGDAARVQR